MDAGAAMQNRVRGAQARRRKPDSTGTVKRPCAESETAPTTRKLCGGVDPEAGQASAVKAKGALHPFAPQGGERTACAEPQAAAAQVFLYVNDIYHRRFIYFPHRLRPGLLHPGGDA